MTITAIGIVQCVLGFWLVFRGSLNQLFLFVLISGMFGGSASFQISAFGSSILPFQVAIIFMVLRIVIPRGGYLGALPSAVSTNAALVLFCVVGIASAYAGPRIFAGSMNVVPLQSSNLRHLFDTVPLQPTNQNVTTALYLMGALVTAITIHIACMHRGGAETLVRGGIFVAVAHSIIGILGVLVASTPAEVIFEFFRNAQYAQLDHSYQGFIRIRGFFAEASSFAAFGIGWFAFNAECWYRDILPKHTGFAAMLLGAVLFFSTSSTAYVCLAAYGVFFMVRILLTRNRQGAKKVPVLMQLGFSLLVLVSIALVLIPSLPQSIWEMLIHMTVDKSESVSGRQRKFWALQGWTAFWHTYGLGIGAGSFRSSSIILAILGSMGIFGIVAFGAYVWRAVRPLRKSTWIATDDLGLTLAGAAACAALVALLPGAISAPSPVPEPNFLIFAGAAIALRLEYRMADQAFRGGMPAFPTAPLEPKSTGV